MCGAESGRIVREPFSEQREHYENKTADQGGDADQEVEGKADAEMDRHPGQVEERYRTRAAEKSAHAIRGRAWASPSLRNPCGYTPFQKNCG